MNWQTVKQRSPRYREITLFNARSPATNWDALSTDLLELWTKLPEIIRQGYEPFPEDKWTRIYFDFWIDSGRIIIFPSPDDVRHARKRTTISVASDLVDGLYHELPDPQADLESFERAHAALETLYLEALKSSLAHPASQLAVARLREWHPFKMIALQFCEPNTAVDLEQ